MMQAKTKTSRVICPDCQTACKRFGKHRNGLQRFRCQSCGKTYTEDHKRPLGGMTIEPEKAGLALQLLIEGTSIRSTERITGLHRDTILKLLVRAGENCEKILGRLLVNVPVRDVQCDEIWGFVYKKEGHKDREEAGDNSIGDAYTFVAIERHTKLVLNFALGRRDQLTTDAFIDGLRQATAAQPFQITTDGFGPYAPAIDAKLSDRVSYAMLIKQYADSKIEEKRYSPADCTGCQKKAVLGNPDPAKISTSHVERQNLSGCRFGG
jgi:transposase-like protein